MLTLHRSKVLIWFVLITLFFALRLSFINLGPAGEAYTWLRFATSFEQKTLHDAYLGDIELNHPAVAVFLSVAVKKFSEVTSLQFSTIMRVATTGADFVIAVLLCLRYPSQKYRTFLLYSIALAPLVVAGGPGNSDSICVLLCVVAMMLATYRGIFLAAIALGFAANIKLIAALLIPGFMSKFRDRKEVSLALFGLITALTPHLIALLLVGSVLLERSIFYKPELTIRWGIQSLLLPTVEGGSIRGALMYRSYGVFLLWGVLILFAGIQSKRKSLDLFSMCALSFLTFVTIAPSFLAHYLVYPAVVLFFRAPSAAFIYSFLTGSFILSVAALTNAWFPQHAALLEHVAAISSVLAWGAGLFLMAGLAAELVGKPLPVFERICPKAR